MRAALVLVSALAVSGCATSAAGLAESDVEMTLFSEKSPQAWATCAAESMIGSVDLRNDGTNWWVLRSNNFQTPVARWDFTPVAAGGSKAELRATISINTGDERVKACS